MKNNNSNNNNIVKIEAFGQTVSGQIAGWKNGKKTGQYYAIGDGPLGWSGTHITSRDYDADNVLDIHTRVSCWATLRPKSETKQTKNGLVQLI